MNAKSFVTFATLTVFASLVYSSVLLAADQCYGAKTVVQDPCEAREKDIRCLMRGRQPVSCVQVRNINGNPVSFEYGEWRSQCGWPGFNVASDARTLPTIKDATTIAMRPISDGNLDPEVCREGFVFNCRIGNTSVRCSDVLGVRLLTY